MGVDDEAKQALEAIDIKKVHDLATSPIFDVASAVYETASSGDPSGGVSRTTAMAAANRQTDGDLAELAGADIETLQGIEQSTADDLSQALGVTTVRDLAQWPPYQGAQAILGALTGEDAETEDGVPEALVPTARQYATEQTFYSRVYIDRQLTDPTADGSGGGFQPGTVVDPELLEVVGTSNLSNVISEVATQDGWDEGTQQPPTFARMTRGIAASAGDEMTAPDRKRIIVLDSASGKTTYKLEVTGTVEAADDELLPPGIEVTANRADVVKESTVAGKLAEGADGFRFSGKIADLSLSAPDAATVYVDGTRWEDGEPLDRTLVIDSSQKEGATEYSLEVSGTLEPVDGERLPPGIDVSWNEADSIENDSVSAEVSTGGDGFRFSGKIEHFEDLDPDEATVYLDGEEIEYPSTLGTTEISLSGSGRIDLGTTDESKGFDAPAVGGIIQFSQKWVPQGLSLGQLLHSTTLAPGESTKVAVIDWSRRTRGQRQETATQREQSQASMTQKRSISEVQDATVREIQKGRSHVSSSSETTQTSTTSQGGVNIGIASGGRSTSTSRSQSSSSSTAVKSSRGRRDVHAETSQKIRNSTQQHASSSRTRRATVVRETEQEESEEVRTRVITNHNHMHALSVHYYEVVQIFRVEIGPEDAKPVLFVPFEPLDFSNRNTILKHRQALLDAALDGTTRHLLDIIAPREDDYTPYSTDRRDRTLVIDGTDDSSGTNYDVSVTGTLKPVDGETLVRDITVTWDDADDATQTTASGTVWEGADGFRFSGEIDQFSVADESAVTVYVDGVEREGSVEHDRTLVIDSRDTAGESTYVLEVGDGVEPVDGERLPPGVEVTSDPADKVSDTIATGHVSSGADGFRFSGAVENLELDDPSAVTVYLNGNEWLATSEFTELVQRLQGNRMHYSQAVWESMDPPTLALMLEDYDINGRPAAEFVDPVPEASHGNLVAFPLALPASVEEADDRRSARLAAWWEDWTDRNFDPDYIDRDLVPLPTGGVHGESILGRANGAEKLDLTRFWDWQDSPIPQQSPQIAPIQTGSRAQDQNLKPSDFEAPIVEMQQPQDLPDPTGVGAVLDTLGQSGIFRDMSGMEAATELAKTTGQISGEGARHAADTAARTFEAATQARVQQTKTLANLAKTIATRGKHSASNAGNSSFGAMYNEAQRSDGQQSVAPSVTSDARSGTPTTGDGANPETDGGGSIGGSTDTGTTGGQSTGSGGGGEPLHRKLLRERGDPTGSIGGYDTDRMLASTNGGAAQPVEDDGAWLTWGTPYGERTQQEQRRIRDSLKRDIVSAANTMQSRNAGYDCADLYYTAVIRAAARNGHPLTISVPDNLNSPPAWDWVIRANGNVYMSHAAAPDRETFAEAVRTYAGAINLIGHTESQPWGDVEPGDTVLYDLQSHNSTNYDGHTAIVVERNGSTFTIVEGHTQGPITKRQVSKSDFQNGLNLTDNPSPVGNAGRQLDWNALFRPVTDVSGIDSSDLPGGSDGGSTSGNGTDGDATSDGN